MKTFSNFYIFIYLLCTLSLQAQEEYTYLDSLYDRCWTLLHENVHKHDSLTAIYYAQARSKKDTYHLAYAYDLKGQGAFGKGMIDSALFYHKKSIQFFKKVNDSLGLSLAHYNISTILEYKGEYQNALYHVRKYREIDIKINDETASDIFYYNNLGGIFYEQEFYEQALKFYKKSYENFLKDSTYHDYLKPYLYVDIGSSYMHLDSMEKAYHWINKGLQRALKDTIFRPIAYGNYIFAKYYKIKKNYQESLKHALRSFYNDSIYGDPNDANFSRILLAEIYIHLNEIKKASYQIEQVENYYNSTEHQTFSEEDLFRVKVKYFKYQEDYKNAFINIQKYDSIRKLNLRKDIYSLLNELENELKQENITRMEEINAMQNQGLIIRNVLLIILLVLVIISLWFVFILQKTKKRLHNVNNVLQAQNRNISRQKAMLEVQQMSITKQNIELQKISTTKNRLLSILSHDLKQPFNQTISVLDLLEQSSSLDSEAEELLEKLKESVSQSSDVVHKLLVWSKAQFEGLQVNPVAIQLSVLIKRVVLQLRLSLENKNQSLDIDVNENFYVFFDEEHLNSILRNLINNAIKFTPKGKEIKLHSNEKDKHIELHINDMGKGLTEKEIKNLLHEEKQYSTTGTNAEMGTGLGLRIVKDFLKENKGKLSIKSQPDEGSVFTITLPKAEAPTNMPG